MTAKRSFQMPHHRRGTAQDVAQRNMTAFHVRVLDALADYRLSFHELMGEVDVPAGMEDRDFAEVVQTLIDAGYITAGGMYEATGLRPPRTIDDEWLA